MSSTPTKFLKYLLGKIAAQSHVKEPADSAQARCHSPAYRAVAEQLEARILFSADPLGIGEPENDLLDNLAHDHPQTAPEENSVELIFIDTTVQNINILLDDLLEQRQAGRNIEIVYLEANVNGITTISSALEQYSNASQIHVLSHGNSSGVQLGSSWLNTDTLISHQQEIRSWASLLNADTNLMFYGCDLAADESGITLLQNIAQLTGANVLASDDSTGHYTLDGDWHLEYQTAETATTKPLLSPTAQQEWLEELAIFSVSVTTTDDNLDAPNLESLESLIANPGPDGKISLREAVIASNNDEGPNEIRLPAFNNSYEIDIGGGDDQSFKTDYDIYDELSIIGQDTKQIVIDADGKGRIFEVIESQLSLYNLFLTGGSSSSDGGAILAKTDTALTMTNVTIEGNFSDVSGGGLHSKGATILSNVTFRNNSASTHGGALAIDDATLTATDLTISYNTAENNGGGIFGKKTNIALNRATIDNNDATNGGGIHFHNGNETLQLNNTTISNNVAGNHGGAIHTENTITVTNSTIAYNKANENDGKGGGLYLNSNADVTIRNSILEQNEATDNDTQNVFGNQRLHSQGYNIDSGTSAALDHATDQSGVSSQLEILTFNRGLVETHALRSYSPAVDQGDPTAQTSTDANGQQRHGQTDIGAAETQPKHINKARTSVLVDGAEDPQWSIRSKYPLLHKLTNNTINTSDLSAYWQSSWDENNLYVRVAVTDDQHSVDGQSTDPQHDDSVYIYLNPNNSRATTYDGLDDLVLKFLRDNSGPTSHLTPANFNLNNVQHNIKETQYGYDLEVAIPWTETGLTPSEDIAFGLDIKVNDDDDGNDRDAAISWRDASEKGDINPSVFGTVIFDGLAASENVTDLNTGLHLNGDGGNNLYFKADDDILNNLTAATIEITYSSNSPGILISSPLPGIEDYLNVSVPLEHQDGKQHTIALSFDNLSGQYRIYTDGSLHQVNSHSQMVGQSIAEDSPLIIGQHYNNTFEQPDSAFKGRLYDIRLWDYARTGSQISQSSGYHIAASNTTYGLIGNWQLGELNSTTNELSNESNTEFGSLQLKTIQSVGEWITGTHYTQHKVSEKASPYDPVGYVYPVDPDVELNSFTYSLIDDSNGRFTVDESTGLIRVLNADGIDLSENDSHTIRVAISDETGSSYEKSLDLKIAKHNTAPMFGYLTNDETHYTLAQPPIVIDANAWIYDAELTSHNNFSGSSLTVTRDYETNAEDIFGHTDPTQFLNQSDLIVGLNSIVIGTVLRNTNGLLEIEFNSNATTEQVNNTLNSITYRNSTAHTSEITVPINWKFSDGNSGALGFGASETVSATKNITVKPITFSASNDSFVLIAGKTITITENQLLNNDLNETTSVARLSNIEPPGVGTLIKNADGSYDFSVPVGTIGTTSLNYTTANSVDSSAKYHWPLNNHGNEIITNLPSTPHGNPTFNNNGARFEDGDYYSLAQIDHLSSLSISFELKIDKTNATQIIFSHGKNYADNFIRIGFIQIDGITYLATGVQDTSLSLNPKYEFHDIEHLEGDGLWHKYTVTTSPLNGTKVYLDGEHLVVSPSGLTSTAFGVDTNNETPFIGAGWHTTSLLEDPVFGYHAKDVAVRDLKYYNYTRNQTEISNVELSQYSTATATFSIKNEEILQEPVQLISEEGGTAVISSTNLTTSDIDTSNTEIVYTITNAPITGTLLKDNIALSNNDTFTQNDINNSRIEYLHDSSETPTNFNIGFKVDDGDGDYSSGTLPVSITTTNDAPQITIDTGVTLQEGTTYKITKNQLRAIDPDNNDGDLQFNITSAPQYGQLENINTPGVPILAFSQQDINDEAILYRQNGSHVATDEFSYDLTDNNVDDPKSVTGTFDLSISLINDTPEFNNSITPIQPLDAAIYKIGNSPIAINPQITITDEELASTGDYTNTSLTLSRVANARSDDVFSSTGQLSPLIENGPLRYASNTIGTVNKNTDGILSITFSSSATAASINAAIRSIGYQNTSIHPQSNVEIEWTFDDANTGTQGSGGNQITKATTLIHLLKVPEFTITTPAQSNTEEDVPLLFNDSNAISLTYDGTPTIPVQLELHVEHGELQLPTAEGMTVLQSHPAKTIIEGPFNNIVDTLEQGITYVPEENYHESDQLKITLRVQSEPQAHYTFDNGDASDSSVGTQHPGIANNISYLNDPTRERALELNGAGSYIQVPNLHLDSDNITMAAWVKFSSSNTSSAAGTRLMQYGDIASINLDADGRGVSAHYISENTKHHTISNQFIADDSWHHVSYSIDSVNNAQHIYIDGIALADSTHTSPISASNNTATIGSNEQTDTTEQFIGRVDDVRFYDRSLSTEEIVLLAKNQDIYESQSAIKIAPINDPPIFSGTIPEPLTATEDTTGLLDLSTLTLTDADSNSSGLLTMTVSNGTLSTTVFTGVTIQGNHSHQLSIQGNTASIDSWIKSNTLSYLSATNANGTASDNLTIAVSDGESDGSMALHPIPINVTPINDPPVSADVEIRIAEDTQYSLSRSDIHYTDIDADDLEFIRINNAPANGTLVNNNTVLQPNDLIGSPDIESGFLKFIPAEHSNGESHTVIRFQVLDNGGNNGQNTSPEYSITFHIDERSDAPNAQNNTVTIKEDETHTFASSDFGFSDPHDSDNIQFINVESIPSNGTLTLNDVPIQSARQILVSDIDNGFFQFTPAEHAHGIPYTNFNFSIQDDGESTIGNTLSETKTITLNVDFIDNHPESLPTPLISLALGSNLNLQSVGPLVSDSDTPNNKLIISSPTDHQQGQFESVLQPGIPLNTFTQQQLLDGEISYRDYGFQHGVKTLILQVQQQEDPSTIIDVPITIATLDFNRPPSFDVSTGHLTQIVANHSSFPAQMSLQKDGKLLLASTQYDPINSAWFPTVARFMVDGSVDTTFGMDGYTVASDDINSHARTVITDSNNKPVVATVHHESIDQTQTAVFSVTRLLPNGAVDTTFGTAGTTKVTFPAMHIDTLHSVQEAPGGGYLVIAGINDNNDGKSDTISMAKLHPDGTLDSTYGFNGLVTHVHPEHFHIHDVGVQSNGSVLIGLGSPGALLKFNSDGTFASEFDFTSPLPDAAVAAVQIQSDNSILLGLRDRDNHDFQLLKLRPNGETDTSFGNNGLATAGFTDAALTGHIAIQSDGSILVSGGVYVQSILTGQVARFSPDGTLDTSFGTNGVASIGGPAVTEQDFHYDLVVRPDDTFLSITSVNQDDYSHSRIVSQNPNGNPQLDFSPTDRQPSAQGETAYIEKQAPVVIAPNIQIYDPDHGFRNNYENSTLTLHRQAGPNVNDIFSATGGLSALSSGSALLLNNQEIGIVTSNSLGHLQIVLNSSTSQAQIDQTLQSIAYSNASYAPDKEVDLLWTFTDELPSDDGSSNSQQASISSKIQITTLNQAPALDLHPVTLATFSSTIPITTSHLQASDLDHKPGELVFTLKSQPQDLQLYKGTIALSTGDTFTQQDINRGLVTVSHIGLLSGNGILELNLSDGTEQIDQQLLFNIIDGPPTDISTGIALNLDGGNNSVLTASANYEYIQHQNLTWEYTFSQLQKNSSGYSTIQSSADDTTGHREYLVIQPNGSVNWFVPWLPHAGIVSNSYTDSSIAFPDLYDGQKHSIAVTANMHGGENSFKLYIDGFEAGSARLNENSERYYSGGYNWSLAQHYTNEQNFDPSRAFSGYLHDVRIWSDVRTAEEIQQSLFVSLDSNSPHPDLLANWQLATLPEDNRIQNITGLTHNTESTHLQIREINDEGFTSSNPSDKLTIRENTPVDTIIGHTQIHDSTPSTSGYVFKLTDSHSGALDIAPDTGSIILVDPAAIGLYLDPVQIAIEVTDKTNPQHTFSKTIQLDTEALNNAPQFINGENSITVKEQTNSGQLNPNINISDQELLVLDNFNNSSLIIQRQTESNAEDIFYAIGPLDPLIANTPLSYNGTTIGEVQGNSAGQLQIQFNNNVTAHLVNSTLRSIGYQNTSDAPPENVTLEWTFIDGNEGMQGSGGSLDSSTTTHINISQINDPPAFTNSEEDTHFTENGAAVVIDNDIRIFDVEASARGHYGGAELTVMATGGNPQSHVFVDTDGRVFSANQPITVNTVIIGQVTLSHNDTLAIKLNNSATPDAVHSWMNQLSYRYTGDNPPAQVSITWSFSDGETDSDSTSVALSTSTTTQIDITAITNPPRPTIAGSNTHHTTEDAAPSTPLGNLRLEAVDNSLMSGATLTFESGYEIGHDTLHFTDTPTITANWDAANGQLSLNGTEAVQNYQNAIQSILFSNNEHLNNAIKSLQLTLFDTQGNSSQTLLNVDVTAVNDNPTINLGLQPDSQPFIENDTALAIAPGILLSDSDSSTLQSALIQVHGGFDYSADQLIFTNTGNIVGDWHGDSGQLILSGTASIDEYQRALRSVRFINTQELIAPNDRDFSISVSDGHSNSRLIVVSVEPINIDDPLIIEIPDTPLHFIEGDSKLTIAPDITLIDPDQSPSLDSAQISIQQNYLQTEDLLQWQSTKNITSNWDARSGTLFLTGIASTTEYQQALRSISYTNINTENPNSQPRAVKISLSDSGGNEYFTTLQLDITSSNDAPTLVLADTDSNRSSWIYPERGDDIFPGALLTIVDVDNSNTQSALITIANGYDPDHDRLTLTAASNLSSHWDAASGTLQIIGPGSHSEFQNALHAIGFSNTDFNPPVQTKSIEFTIDDGNAKSNTVSQQISIAPKNNPPLGSDKNIALNEDSTYTFTSDDLGFSDPYDNHSLRGITLVDITGGGKLQYSDQPVNAGDFIPVNSIDNGQLRFVPDSNEFSTDFNYAAIKFTVHDDGGTQNEGSDASTKHYVISLMINSVADQPIAIQSSEPLLVDENSAPGSVIGQLTTIDADPMENLVLDSYFSLVPTHNTDQTVFAADGTESGAQVANWDVTAGRIGLLGTDWQVSPDNGNAIALHSDLDSSIAQTFFTQPGARYELKFQLSADYRSDTQNTSLLSVSVDDTTTEFHNRLSTDNWSQLDLQWQPQTLSFIATGHTTTIDFSAKHDQQTPIIADLLLHPAHRYQLLNPQPNITVSADGLIYTTHDPIDYEQNSTLTLVVSSSDADNLSTTAQFSVAVRDINEIPDIVANSPLNINDGQSAVINSTLLKATDVDLANLDPATLKYTINSPPSGGLLNLGNVTLSTGQAFSQADINAGLISYQPSGGVNFTDSFGFVLTDENSSSAPTIESQFHIVVDYHNTPPNVVLNQPAIVTEGHAITLTAGHLQAQDSDSKADQLRFVIVNEPIHGQITSSQDGSVSIQDFTQQDIDDGNVKYQHDSSNTLHDHFQFVVHDEGPNADTTTEVKTFPLSITPVSDAPSGKNSTLPVKHSTTMALYSQVFNFGDNTEGDALTAIEIAALPKFGQLNLADHPIAVGDTIATPLLEQGLLRYTPNATLNAGSSDFINFHVIDSGSLALDGEIRSQQPNKLTFNIISSTPARAVNDDIFLQHGDSINSLTNGEHSVLHNDVDIDTPHSKLIAVLDISTEHGSITLHPDGTFNYIHDGSDNLTDSFSYFVSDEGTVDLTPSNSTFVEIVIAQKPIGPTASQSPDQSSTVTQSIHIDLGSDLFTPGNASGKLTFSATQSDGRPLPDWLVFNPDTATITGVPAATDVGQLDISITAIDSNGKSATSSFTLTVTPPLAAANTGAVSSSDLQPKPALAPAFQPLPTSPVEEPNSEPQSSSQGSEKEAPDSTSSAKASTATLIEGDIMFKDHRERQRFEDTVIKNSRNIKVAALANENAQLDQDTNTISLARLFYSSDPAALSKLNTLIRDLNHQHTQLEGYATLDSKAVSGAITISTGLSIGYIVWLVRGGLLIGSVMSSMPAWRWIDPLPILSNINTAKQDNDDESLQSIVESHDTTPQMQSGGVTGNSTDTPNA